MIQRTVVPVLVLVLCSAGPASAQVEPCTPGIPGFCEDFNTCTDDACDAASSTCTHRPLPDGAECSDDDACTEGDTCHLGVCAAGPEVQGCEPCSDDDECNDGDPCTSDVCDLGRCAHEGGDTCDDEDPCTIDDRCTAGECVGHPVVCDDGVPCTDDSCDGGACVHDPSNGACTAVNECAEIECRPDDPRADPQGCVAVPDNLELAECTEDQNPCTVDRCRAGACAHDGVEDPNGCLPLVPSYRRVVALRAGLERILGYLSDEVDAGGETADGLVEPLEEVAQELDAAALVLAGRETADAPPAGGPRGQRLATGTTAQLRGVVALAWLRGTPGHVQDYLAVVSAGRRRGDLAPEVARELRRNGRVLLAEAKALKRDVKNLQRTFSVFQR